MTPKLRKQLSCDGIAGPIQLADQTYLNAACSKAIELKAQRRAQNEKARSQGKEVSDEVNPLLDRHIDIPEFQSLFFDANFQAAIDDLFGRDLFVWRTNFFVKSEGTGQNKWHHDRHFENGREPINLYDTSNHFTVTFALTDVGMDQGRLEYVRGSHEAIDGFNRDIPRHFLDAPEAIEDRVTPMPLKRGQFVLLHSSLLHRSLAFGSGDRRISFAGRLARKGTKIPAYGSLNPAGGAQSASEPNVFYAETGILEVN